MGYTDWNDLDKGGNGGSNGNKVEFTKFPEGITRIRIVEKMPFVRWVHWMPQFKRSVNCPGRGCPICNIITNQKANKEKQTYNSGRRYAIQIINRETNKLEIMEQGKTFFDELRDFAKDYGSLDGYDIRVKRRGTGKDDTSYRLDKDETYAPSESDKKLAEDVINLEEYFKPHEPEKIIRVLNGEAWEVVMSNNDNSDSDSDSEEVVIS